MPIYRLDSVDSTSHHARSRIQAGADAPFVVIAATQTGGIGRRGRRWHSPRGGLWMTIAHPIVTPDLSLAIRISHALWRRFGALGVRDASLKWPNDVYVDDAKVAGVLVQITAAVDRSWAIIGVGVNANLDPCDLAGLEDRATTLRAHLEHAVDLPRLEQQIIEDTVDLIESPSPLEIEPAALWGLGREVSVSMPDGSQRWGVICGLSTDATLVLRTGDVEWSVPAAADVRYR